MYKSGKIWGSNLELFKKNNVEIHRIEVMKGSRCSKHKHQHKYNIFYVESGRILIREWKNDYNLIDDTILNPGDMSSVQPGNYHEFHGLENSIVYEIYYVEIIDNDIIRENIGAKN